MSFDRHEMRLRIRRVPASHEEGKLLPGYEGDQRLADLPPVR